LRSRRMQPHGLTCSVAALVVLFHFPAALAGPIAAEPACALLPLPDLPAIGRAPNVVVWTGEAIAGFQKKRCGASEVEPESVWVLGVAVFQHVGAVKDLLAPFAAVSNYQSIRGGTDDDGKKPLIAAAHALTRADGARRSDFTVAELATGAPRFLSITTASSGPVVYRMVVTELHDHRVALAIDNVTAVRFAGMLALPEGGSRFLWTFDSDRPDVWRLTVAYRLQSSMKALLRAQSADGPAWMEALLTYFSTPLAVALQAPR
jgi:hypothetical protein